MFLLRLFVPIDEKTEYCYYIELKRPFSRQEMATIGWLVVGNGRTVRLDSLFDESVQHVIEVGPQLSFATPFSTNAVQICQIAGLIPVTRVERSVRYLVHDEMHVGEFFSLWHDRMTEMVYERQLDSLVLSNTPIATRVLELLADSNNELLPQLNKELGLGFDDWDIAFNYHLFRNLIERDPTDVELFQLAQMNSEHCRHWMFKGRVVIDGEAQLKTLMEIVQDPYINNLRNSVIAFRDNASAIQGNFVSMLVPESIDGRVIFVPRSTIFHPTINAETHNFPTGVSPFPGATTGTGGRLRDSIAVGRGGVVGVGIAGYCVGQLNIPGYHISGEKGGWNYPENLSSPLDVLIQASGGASDYGNKFGEPVISGYVRSFGVLLPDQTRIENIKPTMYSAGVGLIGDEHTSKADPAVGMKIVMIGGPAYRIGVGGGSASSLIQGQNSAELDFDAVQRGDPEMQQKVYRVIRACIELGDANPILSIHDQGAGGVCNVVTELVESMGGKIDIRKVNSGDSSLSVLEIWCAEYQERVAMLIDEEQLKVFESICRRENVPIEILGEVTDSGLIEVEDSEDGSTPVSLPINVVLENVPQKEFRDGRIQTLLEPFVVSSGDSYRDMIRSVFAQVSVGSNGYLVHKVDRSVGGLVVQQQCVGRRQIPIADYALVAHGFFGKSGTVTAIGEQPNKVLINPAAGARMSIAEMLMNLAMVQISDLEDIKCVLNWMWPARLPGELDNIYSAAIAARDLMLQLGIAIIGGKDSMSMATQVDGEVVKSPGQMVVTGIAIVPDFEKRLTPDIKKPGKTKLLLLDLSSGQYRMGGSALAQSYGQVGKESPDVDDPGMLKSAFLAMQELVGSDLLLSAHDRSDGGLITTLTEMAIAGDSGLELSVPSVDIAKWMFAEELGIVVEYLVDHESGVTEVLERYGVVYSILGHTISDPVVTISQSNTIVLKEELCVLRRWWHSTSIELEAQQVSSFVSDDELVPDSNMQPEYTLVVSSQSSMRRKNVQPKVAVVRDEGSNGDREMVAAFVYAGFKVLDIPMSDLRNNRQRLDDIRGVAFVGGFTYADVLGSARGWAAGILYDQKLREMFQSFYDREDTFSLGICNGCQLMAHLGWIPGHQVIGDESVVFTENFSQKFESRWSGVKIAHSPAIMLDGMAGSVLGVWSAHGEGRLQASEGVISQLRRKNVISLAYVDPLGTETEAYPHNPNGSPGGIAGLCSDDGRHLAMMPHPERAFLRWQWPWIPEGFLSEKDESPWLRMFRNAYDWCVQA